MPMKIDPPLQPHECLMRVRRPDGLECWLRFPGENLQRVMDRTEKEFGKKDSTPG